MADGNDVSPTWRVLTAAATGVAHHAQRGYEDALAVTPTDARERPQQVVSAAVADGHGHARHFRSSRGSKLAVGLATAKGAELAARVPALSGADAVMRELTGKTGVEVVADWRAAVVRDLAADPPSTAELVAAGYAPDAGTDELIYIYGATMILAVVLPGWLLCAQIGDGDVLVVTTAGKVLRPIAADARLDGIHTTSLCQPDATEMMRYGAVRLADAGVAAVMLATDGYGNAQARDDWDGVFAADLAALTAVHGIDWIGQQLPRWAEQCASSLGSGDDVTVALLIAVDAPWAPEPYESAVSNLLEERTLPVTAARPLLPGGRPVNVDQTTVLSADQATVVIGEQTAVVGREQTTAVSGDQTTVISVERTLVPRVDRVAHLVDDRTVALGGDDATIASPPHQVAPDVEATVPVERVTKPQAPAVAPAQTRVAYPPPPPPSPYPTGPRRVGQQPLSSPRSGPTGWQLVQVGVLAGVIAGSVALLLLLFLIMK